MANNLTVVNGKSLPSIGKTSTDEIGFVDDLIDAGLDMSDGTSLADALKEMYTKQRKKLKVLLDHTDTGDTERKVKFIKWLASKGGEVGKKLADQLSKEISNARKFKTAKNFVDDTNTRTKSAATKNSCTSTSRSQGSGSTTVHRAPSHGGKGATAVTWGVPTQYQGYGANTDKSKMGYTYKVGSSTGTPAEQATDYYRAQNI